MAETGYVKEFPSPLHSGFATSLALFDNVENTDEIRTMAINGQLSVALVKPALVLDEFQAAVAGTQAIHHEVNSNRITKNLQSEFLFCLSPNKNITDAFRRFGVANGDRSILVAEIHPVGESCIGRLQDLIKGTPVPISNLSDMADETLIKKTYKIQDQELNVGTLLEAIVLKIASKDLM